MSPIRAEDIHTRDPRPAQRTAGGPDGSDTPEGPDGLRAAAVRDEAGGPGACHGSPDRAIVIGASIAGLLAARVLSERFAEVVLFERDDLPAEAGARKGTPQALHPHGLLARGREVMEQLFPGFTEALLQRGALTGDIGADSCICADRRRLASRPAGIRGVTASRLAIEGELRRRMRQRPGVRFVTGVDVVAPVHDAGRVTGVRTRSLAAAQGSGADAALQVWPAALVVDCSGRGSRLPAWLREWGYDAAPEERVRVDIAYTSAYFERDALERPASAAVIGVATADHPQPSILLAQEPDGEGRARWVAGLGGYGGDHVGASREAMLQRALATGQSEIAALCAGAPMIGEPMRYAFPHSQWRHYERLARFPEGLLALGDSIASFNPVYGQGMSAAAGQALALQQALAGGTAGLARRYFRAAARVVATPWQLAVGGDLAIPQVQGERTRATRFVNGYLKRVRAAAEHDAVVSAAFRRVVHLLSAPPSLFAPGVVWRVLRHRPPRAADERKALVAAQ